VLREAWWPYPCSCGIWIGLSIAPGVYDPKEPTFTGVCPKCGAAYYLDIFVVFPVDPGDPV
jgi:hypothetical protein